MPEKEIKPKSISKKEAKSEILSVDGNMKLVIAVALDTATIICAFFYTLGVPGIFIGEVMSYIPKTLSMIFLGNWSVSNKKMVLGNKKVLLKMIPVFGNLPLNTLSQLGIVNSV